MGEELDCLANYEAPIFCDKCGKEFEMNYIKGSTEIKWTDGDLIIFCDYKCPECGNIYTIKSYFEWVDDETSLKKEE